MRCQFIEPLSIGLSTNTIIVCPHHHDKHHQRARHLKSRKPRNHLRAPKLRATTINPSKDTEDLEEMWSVREIFAEFELLGPTRLLRPMPVGFGVGRTVPEGVHIDDFLPSKSTACRKTISSDQSKVRSLGGGWSAIT